MNAIVLVHCVTCVNIGTYQLMCIPLMVYHDIIPHVLSPVKGMDQLQLPDEHAVDECLSIEWGKYQG